MRRETIVRSVGQAIEVNDILIEVTATHPSRVELRIVAPDGAHIAAEIYMDWLREHCETYLAGHRWKRLRPRNGDGATP